MGKRQRVRKFERVMADAGSWFREWVAVKCDSHQKGASYLNLRPQINNLRYRMLLAKSLTVFD